MLIPTRTPLVAVDRSILSSYDARGQTGGPRANLRPLADRSAGRMAPDAATALLRLQAAVLGAGGDFRVTDCLRDVSEQRRARARYEAWLAAGKPAPVKSNPKWNPVTMKADYVAMPGLSFHNAGRSVDLDLGSIRFPVAASLQLDRLWELARPLGWSAVIERPTEGVSESWHLDRLGPWTHVRARLGYAAAAMAACLDVGIGIYGDDLDRWKQAQLHRAGFDVGAIDGAIGPTTKAGAKAARVDLEDLVALAALPDATAYRWHP